MHVAIKVEPTKARSQRLWFESKVYGALLGSVGIPRIRRYGCAKEHYILVMDLFNFCSRKFTMKTVLMLADPMPRNFAKPRAQKSAPARVSRGKIGTARSASINALQDKKQSWRDDMVSLGYVLINLSRGFFPWQCIKANTKVQKYERIKEQKRSIPIEALCKGYAQELAIYLRDSRTLLIIGI